MQTGQAVAPTLDSPDGDNNWLVARNSFLRINDWPDDSSVDNENYPRPPAASNKLDDLPNQQQQPSTSKQNPVAPVAKQRGGGVDAAVVPKVQYILPGPAAAMPAGHGGSRPNTAAAGHHARKSSNVASTVPTKAGATPTKSGPHFKDQMRQGGVASSGGSATTRDVSSEQHHNHSLISAELVTSNAPAAERTSSSSLPIFLGAQVLIRTRNSASDDA
jgi:hypothetical protein